MILGQGLKREQIGPLLFQEKLLFLTFSAWVANPKKLLYTVANPARGLLNRKKKKKVWQPPSPPQPIVVVVVVVVSHIQRIGCQPEKTTLHGGQSRSNSGLVNIVLTGKKKKITRRIHMSRRYASRRYAAVPWTHNVNPDSRSCTMDTQC